MKSVPGAKFYRNTLMSKLTYMHHNKNYTTKYIFFSIT
jgi:hypothetical protein